MTMVHPKSIAEAENVSKCFLTIFTRALLPSHSARSSEILSYFNTYSAFPSASKLIAADVVLGGVVDESL